MYRRSTQERRSVACADAELAAIKICIPDEESKAQDNDWDNSERAQESNSFAGVGG